MKTNRILVVIILLALSAYAFYTNRKLENTISKYEANSLTMAKKFQELNEARIKDREEMEKQKAAMEETIAVRKTEVLQVEKVAVETKKAEEAVADKKAALPTVTQGPVVGGGAREKAEKTKAEVEAMLKQMSTAPEPWERRESHL